MRAEVVQVVLDHWWCEDNRDPPVLNSFRAGGHACAQLHECVIPRLTPHLGAEVVRSITKSAVSDALVLTMGGRPKYRIKFVADEADVPEEVERLRALVALAKRVRRYVQLGVLTLFLTRTSNPSLCSAVALLPRATLCGQRQCAQR